LDETCAPIDLEDRSGTDILAGLDGTVARSARELVARCRALTAEINQLEREINELVANARSGAARDLRAALHRIALTQTRLHPGAKVVLARRRANGDGGLEALRVLRRRLSDVVYRAILADAHAATATVT
jgi:hypothetical protein